MFEFSKTYHASELERGVEREVQRHEAAQVNPGTAQALRLAADTAKGFIRQVPNGLRIAVRVRGNFDDAGKGTLLLGFSALTDEEARVLGDHLEAEAASQDEGEDMAQLEAGALAGLSEEQTHALMDRLAVAESALVGAGFTRGETGWLSPEVSPA